MWCWCFLGSELVSEKFGTRKRYRYRYHLTFWVPSHTDFRGAFMPTSTILRGACMSTSTILRPTLIVLLCVTYHSKSSCKLACLVSSSLLWYFTNTCDNIPTILILHFHWLWWWELSAWLVSIVSSLPWFSDYVSKAPMRLTCLAWRIKFRACWYFAYRCCVLLAWCTILHYNLSGWWYEPLLFNM